MSTESEQELYRYQCECNGELPMDFIVPERRVGNKDAPKRVPCASCGLESAYVPYDSGDGKIRCANCAVDRFMSTPFDDERF